MTMKRYHVNMRGTSAHGNRGPYEIHNIPVKASNRAGVAGCCLPGLCPFG